MPRPRKIVLDETSTEPQKETKIVKSREVYMSVMMRDSEEVKNIKKSEYDSLIHICL